MHLVGFCKNKNHFDLNKSRSFHKMEAPFTFLSNLKSNISLIEASSIKEANTDDAIIIIFVEI